MASHSNFSTALFSVTVNAREITDWGNADPAYTDEPIDQKNTITRGQGDSSVKTSRINPGRRVTLNISAGSPDATYLQTLLESGATVELTKTQIGTLESAIGVFGAVVNDQTVGRAGSAISDNVFILEFAKWEGTK